MLYVQEWKEEEETQNIRGQMSVLNGDAHDDLSLHWAHTHFVGFVMRRPFSVFFFICLPHRKALHPTFESESLVPLGGKG